MHTRQLAHRVIVAGLAVMLAACSSSESGGGDPTSTMSSAASSAPVTGPDGSPITGPDGSPITGGDQGDRSGDSSGDGSGDSSGGGSGSPTPTQPPASEFDLYDEVPAPAVPADGTDPFVASGVLADGVYWATYSGGETMTPSISVVQAFFGAECATQAAAQGEECVNDYYVMSEPSRDIDDLPFSVNVFLTVTNQATQQSLRITPDELRIIRASSPSEGAPDGFSFGSFPFLMTVRSGQIVSFEQVWLP